jgi:hypothetical protein
MEEVESEDSDETYQEEMNSEEIIEHTIELMEQESREDPKQPDQIDDKKANEESENKIKFLPLIKASKGILFLTNLQRKMKYCPLIEVDSFVGTYDKISLGEAMTTKENNIFGILYNNGNTEVRINTENAIDKIRFELFPFIRLLKFDGYCLAGGAALWAVSNSYDSPDDLDFFPVVGEFDGSYWKDHKIERARKIYQGFLAEMIKLEQGLKHHSLLVWQNQNSTTFSFYNDYRKKSRPYNEDNEDDEANYKSKHLRDFKISFIHRAYDTPDQILKGFDLAPSQFLYDGKSFKCSPAAAWSVVYGILPVDVSSASDSFYTRLQKYHTLKGFSLIFAGFDHQLALEREQERLEKEEPVGKKIKESWKKGLRIDLPRGAFIKYRGEGMVFELSDAFERNRNNRYDNFIDPASLAKESDYGDVGQYVLSSNRFFELYAMKQYVVNGLIYKRSRSCDTLATSYFNLEEIIRKYCSFNQFRPQFEIGEVFPNLFGQDAEKALFLYLTRKKDEFNLLLDKILPKVLEKYEEAKRIDQEGLVFIVDEPGVQTRRSFKPVELTARGFYREYYNGFNCTMDWPAKCQIITAYRKKINGEENILDCPLLSLGIHLIRKIFNILDLLYFEEYMVEFKKYHMSWNE